MTTVTISTDGPRDPQYVLEVAAALAEAARVLNHLTLSHEALAYPSEADKLIREVASAAARLPQLLGQVGRWLAGEQEAGRIRIAGERAASDRALAVVTARIHLDAAAAIAGQLQEALDAAASVTQAMGSDDRGEGSGDAGAGSS